MVQKILFEDTMSYGFTPKENGVNDYPVSGDIKLLYFHGVENEITRHR